jgi:hypothetical protein
MLVVMPDDSCSASFARNSPASSAIENTPDTVERRASPVPWRSLTATPFSRCSIATPESSRPARDADRAAPGHALGDWDRHAGNWMWAGRVKPREMAAHSAGPRQGLHLGGESSPGWRAAVANMAFDSTYPSVRGLAEQSGVRPPAVLGLARPAWD